jgi:monothiol glutaredoxin
MSIEAIHQTISQQIKAHPIVLYMKGLPEQPQCGYSAAVIKILLFYKVPLQAYNVLEDEILRAGIKSFTHWPTIPQLYVNGLFIGGYDIIQQLHDEDQLSEILQG